VARYGHQPISEIRNLTVAELSALTDALGRIIGRENESSSE